LEPPIPQPPTEITVARVRKTQGRKGEVAAEILTDFPDRFQHLKQVVLVQPDGTESPQELEASWFHKNGVVLKFSGVDSITDAERLVGCEVRVPGSEARPLPSDRHYIFELVGCRVIDDRTGQLLGKVAECMEYGGQWSLNVETDEGDVLIPFAAEICCSIDTSQHEIRVRLPEGLLDVNRRRDPLPGPRN
jgi:16S rRNA processing protein RimM